MVDQFRLTQINGSLWSQLGDTIRGSSSDLFGHSVSLSDDGMRVIVGSKPRAIDQAGYAEVYTYSGTNWIRFGQILPGSVKFENHYGSVIVGISGNGMSIAIGESIFGGAGLLKVYNLN